MSDRLVTIAVFGQSADAHLARGALEAAGIRVALQNEETSSLFGSMSTPLGGVRLVVLAEDEPAALKVLDEAFGPNEPIGEDELAAQAVAAAPNAAAAEAAETVSDPALDALYAERDRRAVAATFFGYTLPFGALLFFIFVGLWSNRRRLTRVERATIRVASFLVFLLFTLGLVLLVWYLS